MADIQTRIERFRPQLQAHAKLLEQAEKEDWFMPPISLEEKLERLEQEHARY
jgi:hypothetical protein